MVAAKLRTTYVQEFTGGMNLGPPQELAQNEVAIARDVVFSARGGIQTRPGFVPFSAYALDGPTGFVHIMTNVHFRKSDSIYQVFGIKESDQTLWWSNGDKWFPVTNDNASDTSAIVSGGIIGFFADGTPVGPNGVQFQDNTYFTRLPSLNNVMWNGYVGKVLGTAYDNDIANPQGLNQPRSEVIAAKGQFVFTGSNIEPAENQYRRNRIRWCHPGRPTSWRQQDFIDLDAGVIKAMVPFRDYLAIFTDDAIYGLFGEDTDSFSLQTITADSGTPFHWCVSASPSTLYWWDWDQGVMALEGGAPKSVFTKMKPFLDRRGFAQPQTIYQSPPNLIWGEGKLYAHFANLNSRVYPASQLGSIFVYDPRVGQMGSWTTYSNNGISRGSCVFPRLYQSDLVVFGASRTEKILNDQTAVLDRNFLNDSTDFKVPTSLVRTAPFEGPTNATKKRWRRPRVTIRSASSKQTIQFGYLRNYDEGVAFPVNDISLNFNSQAGVLSGLWVGANYFSDAFNQNETGLWSGFNANVLASGGDLNITTTTVSGTRALTSVSTVNMVNAVARVKTTAQPAAASQQFLVFNGNEFFRFNLRVAANALDLEWRNAAAVQSTTTVTFNAGTMAWWRIREQDGVVYWETSPDSVTWTVQRQLADPIPVADIGAMSVQLSQGQSTAGTPTGKFDMLSVYSLVNDTEWDTDDKWAFDPDVTTSDMPDNYIFFETLPSGGAANALQLEIKSKTGPLSDTVTNDSWGLDSIVLPFYEKGVR